MKLGLQIVLGILSLIPVFFGVTGLLYGAEQLMPEGQTAPPALDNQFRYWAGFYFVLAFLLWWAIPNIERHTTLLRIVCLALVIGGTGRLISYLTVGEGGPDQFGAMILEIGSVIFVFWQARLPKEEMEAAV